MSQSEEQTKGKWNNGVIPQRPTRHLEDNRSKSLPPRNYRPHRQEFSRKRRRSFSRSKSPRHGDSSPASFRARRGKPLYPPRFDSPDGVAFVLQEESGLFYDRISQFYFDPRSNLYFQAVRNAFFRYDASQDPPRFSNVRESPKGSNPHQSDVSSRQEPPRIRASAPNASSKNNSVSIPIHLKTTKFKKSKKGEGQAKRSKEAKPGQRKKRRVDGPALLECEILPTSRSDDTKGSEISLGRKKSVLCTKIGEPICSICKRKFQSPEKLKIHVEKSALHRTNVLRLEATKITASSNLEASALQQNVQQENCSAKPRSTS